MTSGELKFVKPIQLQAGHKYLLLFDRTQLSREDMLQLTKLFQDEGVTSIAVGVAGDLHKVKVVDLTEQEVGKVAVTA